MYIYQDPDWPRFSWQHPSLSFPLARVRHSQGLLLGRMKSLGFQLRAEASLSSLTEDVIKTSEIEGEILERSQVRSSLARRLGMDIAALTPSDRNVDGVVEMMLDATLHHQSNLTSERLFSWHAALFPTNYSGMRKIAVGQWRSDAKGPMQVVSGSIGRERVHFEAPAATRLPKEMKHFLKWFNHNDESDPVLKAAIAHLWFVTVHPFEDGNGRIARAVSDMLLARSELSPQRFYSMSAQIRADRSEYYKILETTQKGGLDITAWLLWFLSCLARAIEGAESNLATVLHKARFWERHSADYFNDRQRLVLNRLLDGFEGKLSSSKWAKLTKCSQDTAARDIGDLINRNVLIKDPAGGRSTSYSLAPRS